MKNQIRTTENRIIEILTEAMPNMKNSFLKHFASLLRKDIVKLGLAGNDIENYIEFAIEGFNS